MNAICILRGVLRQLFCRHNFEDGKLIEEEVIGVEMHWDGLPAPKFRWTKTCAKCGALGCTEGILPRGLLRKLYGVDPYQPDGPAQWPVDPDSGEKLRTISHDFSPVHNGRP